MVGCERIAATVHGIYPKATFHQYSTDRRATEYIYIRVAMGDVGQAAGRNDQKRRIPGQRARAQDVKR